MMWNPHRGEKNYLQLLSTLEEMGGRRGGGGRRGSRTSLPPLRAFAIPQEPFISPLFELQSKVGVLPQQTVWKWAGHLGWHPVQWIAAPPEKLTSNNVKCNKNNQHRHHQLHLPLQRAWTTEGFLKQVNRREGRRHKGSLKEKGES